MAGIHKVQVYGCRIKSGMTIISLFKGLFYNMTDSNVSLTGRF